MPLVGRQRGITPCLRCYVLCPCVCLSSRPSRLLSFPPLSGPPARSSLGIPKLPPVVCALPSTSCSVLSRRTPPPPPPPPPPPGAGGSETGRSAVSARGSDRASRLGLVGARSAQPLSRNGRGGGAAVESRGIGRDEPSGSTLAEVRRRRRRRRRHRRSSSSSVVGRGCG